MTARVGRGPARNADRWGRNALCRALSAVRPTRIADHQGVQRALQVAQRGMANAQCRSLGGATCFAGYSARYGERAMPIARGGNVVCRSLSAVRRARTADRQGVQRALQVAQRGAANAHCRSPGGATCFAGRSALYGERAMPIAGGQLALQVAQRGTANAWFDTDSPEGAAR